MTRRLLPLFSVIVLLALVAAPAAVQAADTTTTTAATQPEPAGLVPPAATQTPLNAGWTTDQVQVRVMPEYDEHAVLVIMNFSLPADVPLPATLQLPIPAGARITGVGEIDPAGNFVYNYGTSYPTVVPGTMWDVAAIDVKTYRKLQIDYYYDPGLPAGAGQRFFPLLVQIPLDAGVMVLHLQEPARSTDFVVDPALEASGQAGDGFTYWVAAYPDVKSGSSLGHTVVYYKGDGAVSLDSPASGGTTQVSTNTVLLAAILIVVVVVGAIVIYRLFFSSGGRGPKKGRANGGRGSARPAPSSPAAATRRGQAAKGAKGVKSATARPTGANKGAAQGSAAAVTAATEPGDAVATAADSLESAATAEDGAATTEAGRDPDAKGLEYCVACGEELSEGSPFCPRCGEARS